MTSIADSSALVEAYAVFTENLVANTVIRWTQYMHMIGPNAN